MKDLRKTIVLLPILVLLVTGTALADGGEHEDEGSDPNAGNKKEMNSGQYQVQKGDSLWDIAEEHLGDPYQWTKIYELNREIVSDPDTILQGQFLTLPQLNDMHGHHHNVEPVEIPDDVSIPTVDVKVIKDSMSGWNLHVKTTHFIFSPEHVSTSHQMGEGHAHLYIDGKKITRLYGSWYYIGELDPGKHEVKVNLYSNNHAPYVENGKEISDTVMITVQE